MRCREAGPFGLATRLHRAAEPLFSRGAADRSENLMKRVPAIIELTVVTAFSIALAGCSLLPGWGTKGAPDTGAPRSPAESPVFVTAVPSYRLLVNTTSADAPSRLIVLYTRIEARSDASVPFALSSLRLRLGNGQVARIFDPDRAAVLVRRTRLGAPDLSYLHTSGGRHLPGGLPSWGQEALRTQLLEHLLTGGTLRPGEAMQGYLVVDTLEPLVSLDGAVLEVTVEEGSIAAGEAFLFTRTGGARKDTGGTP
jgi:hypothetical protein